MLKIKTFFFHIVRSFAAELCDTRPTFFICWWSTTNTVGGGTAGASSKTLLQAQADSEIAQPQSKKLVGKITTHVINLT